MSLFDTCGVDSDVSRQGQRLRAPPVSIDVLFEDISAPACDSSAIRNGRQAKRNVCVLDAGLPRGQQLPDKKIKPVVPGIKNVDIDEIFGI